jgi:hypothetical protein
MSEPQNTPDLYDDPDSAGEYEYDDAAEYHTVERLREIHNSRKRFDKKRHEVYHAADMGRITHDRARTFTAQLALDFIRHLEPLVRRTDSDLLEREVQLPHNDRTVTATVGELLDGSGTVEIETTEQYLNPETNARGRRTVRESVTLDRAAANRLVRLGDDFLEDIVPSGLTDTGDDVAEWDYSDLI